MVGASLAGPALRFPLTAPLPGRGFSLPLLLRLLPSIILLPKVAFTLHWSKHGGRAVDNVIYGGLG